MVPISFMWLTLFLILVTSAANTDPKVTAVFVFGDSTVDSGNNNQIPTLVKSNFGPYGRDFPGQVPTGRYCNGRLPPDFISEAFGIKQTVPAYLDPMYNISDFATGACFASSGSGYDDVTSNFFAVLPLGKQLEYYAEYQNKLRAYVGAENANKIISGAIHIVSMGTDDFLLNYYVLPRRRLEYTVDQYQDFLLGIAQAFVKALHGLGAMKITLASLPPMGCLPLERSLNILNGHNCVERFNDVALQFNSKLQQMVADLNKELPGIKVVVSDIYYSLLQLIQKPSEYGIEAVAVGCCGTGTFELGYACNRLDPFTCQDANKYIFWDAFHPTERANQIITEYLLPTYKKEFLN